MNLYRVAIRKTQKAKERDDKPIEMTAKMPGMTGNEEASIKFPAGFPGFPVGPQPDTIRTLILYVVAKDSVGALTLVSNKIGTEDGDAQILNLAACDSHVNSMGGIGEHVAEIVASIEKEAPLNPYGPSLVVAD